jgi:hypothetical protein
MIYWEKFSLHFVSESKYNAHKINIHTARVVIMVHRLSTIVSSLLITLLLAACGASTTYVGQGIIVQQQKLDAKDLKARSGTKTGLAAGGATGGVMALTAASAMSVASGGVLAPMVLPAALAGATMGAGAGAGAGYAYDKFSKGTTVYEYKVKKPDGEIVEVWHTTRQPYPNGTLIDVRVTGGETQVTSLGQFNH